MGNKKKRKMCIRDRLNIAKQAGAEVAGVGAVIEKGFQGGSSKIREAGCRVESLVVIEKVENGNITFA